MADLDKGCADETTGPGGDAASISAHTAACEDVVRRGLCIGCGVCTAVCPTNRLDIALNEVGSYAVRTIDRSCSATCDICARVCPFQDGNPDEDHIATQLFGQVPGIRQDDQLGYYTSCRAGYAAESQTRSAGASGGLATWFLGALLETSTVDHVICVSPTPGSEALFGYSICESMDEIRQAAKSAYYPVELSKALSIMRSVPGRYAVTALPCTAKALRLAAQTIPVIRDRLVAVIGLTCGHTVSSFFAEYAGELTNPGAGLPNRVTFRTKALDGPASELGTACEWDGDPGSPRTVYWSQGMGRAWSKHWFTPNPCFYCDDIFAEVADITFMDAWLPEYVQDPRGTNLVVVRSEMAESIIRSGMADGSVTIDDCPPQAVIESQSGVVDFKGGGLAHRLWLSQNQRKYTPTRRVAPRRMEDPHQANWIEARMRASEYGLHHWRNRISLQSFIQEIKGVEAPAPTATHGAGLQGTLRSAARRLLRLGGSK